MDLAVHADAGGCTTTLPLALLLCEQITAGAG
jgi:hypothetical protein